MNSKLKSLRKGSLALMAGSIIAVALPATASFATGFGGPPPSGSSATSATSTENLTLTAGSLSVSSTKPSTIDAVVGALGSGALPSATWADLTGTGNGWNGTVQASDLVYTGAWQGANAATDLTSTSSSPFTGLVDGVVYTVTVGGTTTSPTASYTSTDAADSSGTVAVTPGTAVAVGNKGLTINFKTLTPGDVFTIQAGTQSDNAINLALAGTNSSIAAVGTLFTGMPTFYSTNASANLLGGGSVSNSALGSSVKFLTAAANTGMGSYTVVPGATIQSDINSWAATYTANIQYNIITGP